MRAGPDFWPGSRFRFVKLVTSPNKNRMERTSLAGQTEFAMKVHFLGTAAAEGIPALFCRCDLCQKTRALGGKNIRTRTSVMIDDVLKIDFPPDTYLHLLRYNLDLCKVKDIFFTHSHPDHLQTGDIKMRLSGFSHGCDVPLNVYGNESVLHKLRPCIGQAKEFRCRLIRPFLAVEAETALVTPLLANHDPEENCLLLHIERNGKHILYGHDSGWFPPETWEWLEGKKLDAVILDCTHGPSPERRGHMGTEAVLETRGKLLEKGAIGSASPVIATHFSHNGKTLHEDLVEILAPQGIQVAYDGMFLDLNN